MRDYLYIWQPNAYTLLVSGIEFNDLKKHFSGNALILIKHGSVNCRHDSKSRFDYMPANKFAESDKAIYSWGDFVLMVCSGIKMPNLCENEIKSILYFSHSGISNGDFNGEKVAGGIIIHDNGWLFEFQGCSKYLNSLVSFIENSLGLNGIDLVSSKFGTLIFGNQSIKVVGTRDIDKVLNTGLPKFKKGSPTR